MSITSVVNFIIRHISDPIAWLIMFVKKSSFFSAPAPWAHAYVKKYVNGALDRKLHLSRLPQKTVPYLEGIPLFSELFLFGVYGYFKAFDQN